MKLSEPMINLLRLLETVHQFKPPQEKTFDALFSRGLIEDDEVWDYRLTDAGRSALAAAEESK